MRSSKKKYAIIIFTAFIVLLFWYFKFAGHHLTLERRSVPKNFWGITFSRKYATELELNWREAYIALLDELQIKNVRLPVYWDDVEREQGIYDLSDYDWMLEQGEARDVNFILNIGRRLPRWPECHQPTWTKSMHETEIDERHVAAVKIMIDHFKTYDSIRYWQLENEYFFPWFGECPEADPGILRQEIDYLNSQDARKLILTDSGELNSWRESAKYSDILGITIYRVVWSKYFGYFRYPWPAALYRIKAKFVDKAPSTTIVAELQAEPWPAHFRKVNEITITEAEKSFSLRQFETNSEVARRTGFQQAYFWGAEWWYWMKIHGDSRMWDKAHEIIQSSNAQTGS